MLTGILTFFRRDIWRIPRSKLKGPQGLLIRTVRVLIASIREFSGDQCLLRASALTFYTLLSIVPVLAMAFGVAKGFGLDKLLKEKLLENAYGQEEIFTRIVDFSENFIQNTKGGLIAGVGLALLFWTVIKVLTDIEAAFNHIWGIKKGRTLGRRFTDYLSLMLIAPVFFAIASSATVFMAAQVKTYSDKMSILNAFDPTFFVLLKFLPAFIFAGLLTYVYMFMPNGKIHWKSALLGGLVAGFIYQAVQWAYIHFQIGASSAGAVYGTFAALPLFLVWVQLSWSIVLYGAELAFTHQNEQKFEYEKECLDASERFKKLLALRILQLTISRFCMGQTPLTDEQTAEQIGLPTRMTRDLFYRLTRAGLLSQIQEATERGACYQPAKDVGQITVEYALSQWDQTGTDDIPITRTPEIEILSKTLEDFDRILEDLPGNLMLKDLTSAPLALKA